MAEMQTQDLELCIQSMFYVHLVEASILPSCVDNQVNFKAAEADELYFLWGDTRF